MKNYATFSMNDAPLFSSPLEFFFSSLCLSSSSCPSSSSSLRYCSPGMRGAQVESVRGWRAQAKSEEAAGFESSMKKVLISFYRCAVCGIHIGPGYYEQTMYLYPVYQQSVNCIDGPLQYFESSWLTICGGCAHDRRRLLPEWLCILRPEHWTTTLLLCQEGEIPVATDMTNKVQMTAIRRAIHAYVDAFYAYVFCLFAFIAHLPLSLLSSAHQQQRVSSSSLSSKDRSTEKETDAPLTPKNVYKQVERGQEATILQFPIERTKSVGRPLRRIPASLAGTYQIAQ